MKSYRLGLAFQPDSPEVLSNLGCLLDDLGSRDEAESVHRKAVALAPNVAVMHNNLGLTLQSLGKTEEAEACFRKAIELRADWTVARLNLGRLLQMNERHADSIEHYERVLEIDPSNARAKNNLGIALEHLGDLAGATAAFQAAIAADAGLVAAHRRLAEVQQRQVPLWHISMLNDHARNEAYQGALRTAIDSDSRVLEIGTGAGLLSMFAARMGPKSLTTCEAEPLVAQMASKVIENNGLASRISLIPKRSTELQLGTDLPEPANVLVFELFSSELLGERVLASIEDAKLRLLQPGCRIIPASASLMIALFGGERLASNLSVETVEGLDLSAFNQVITRRQMLARDDLEIELLGDETEAFRFDFEQQKEWVPQCTQIRIPVTVEGRCYG
ncbi:MAG: tetratricopeptide repeat protein, partial [Bryobacterales bacterium]|nr:tetratricopeptide repeat protein [Bryobacterales bacterium]